MTAPLVRHESMRVLFATTRGAGHFMPLVPLARACVRAGHTVLVAGPASAGRMVNRAELPFRAVAEAPRETVAAAFAPVFSPDRKRAPGAAYVIRELFVGLHARTALPDMLALVEGWRPDVVVRETMEFASTLAAERHGVRQVRVGVHLQAVVDGNAGPLALAAEPLDALRPAAGLEPQPELSAIRDSPLLTLAPASLDVPGAPPAQRFGDPYTAYGGSTSNGDRPLVFVSFGSEAPSGHFPGLYGAALEALADLDAQVVMAIGDRSDPAALGALPANARVERWVPQAAVVSSAAAMVGHGGSGSTLAALTAGVPLAFVPLFVDGPTNAGRVAELGAGLVVDGAEELGPAVAALLDRDEHRAAARAVAAEIAALPPIDDAVALLRA